MDNRPIGVFDSGLGGLTVLKEIMEAMPNESIVYFGDNGRTPYGTKSKETVIKYTLQNIKFLLTQDIKMMVIACNTASACSYDVVKNGLNIPVVEVIRPGAAAVVKKTRSKRVGVIGTPVTINSGVYEKAIKSLDGSVKIVSKACPLFVPLVEEGWWDNDIARLIAEEYLRSLKEEGIDALLLGCTHYPLLHATISKVMGPDVELVSSAREITRAVKEIMERQNLQSSNNKKPVYSYYTSDSVERFKLFGSHILGREIESARWVDIEKY